MIGALIFVLILLMLAVLLALAAIYLRLQQPSQANEQTAVLSERLSQLAPVAQTVNNIQSDLAGLQAHVEARRELEQRTADSVRRLETVIAGTQSKGAAGENILEAVFNRLPVEWQIRDFKVGKTRPSSSACASPTTSFFPWTASGRPPRLSNNSPPATT